MKNKRGIIETKIGTIITIILLIIVLFIGFYLINKIFDQQKFTIYKEECRNKEMEIGKPILMRDYEISIDGKTERIKEYIKYYNTTTLIICKQVEVDYLKDYSKCSLNKQDFGNNDTLTVCFNDEGKIFKKDLSIAWLDENCGVYWCDDQNRCDYFESIYNYGWNKWKCEFDETYYVEVEK